MNNMLHTKLLMTSTALLMAFPFDISAQELELKSAFSNSETFKLARACFLPDCGEDIGDINMDINNDTRWCEKKGYTYYSSGKCPEYYVLDDTCKKDSHYLKCNGDKWCKNNGYGKTACASTQTLDTACPNNLPYYKNCKCKSEFRYYSGNCSGNNKPEGTSCASSGTGTGLDTKTYYNQCNCYPTPPNANYSYTCTGSEVQADGCGRYYHRCCSDECPTSGTSKSYSGSTARSTECGSRCYYFRSCPSSASTSYHGSSAGYDDNGKWCGNYCSSSCSSGSNSPSCAWNERQVTSGSSECGTCYSCQYNPDCSRSPVSCNGSGQYCNSTNSCGICTGCYTPCSNSCSSGSTSRPSGDYKVVGYTGCGNACYASCSNTCNTGYSTAGCTYTYASYTNSCGNTCRQCTDWVVYSRYTGYACDPMGSGPEMCPPNGVCRKGEMIGFTFMKYGCYNTKTRVYGDFQFEMGSHAFYKGYEKYYSSRSECEKDYGANYKSYGGKSTGLYEYDCSNVVCTPSGQIPSSLIKTYISCSNPL